MSHRFDKQLRVPAVILVALGIALGGAQTAVAQNAGDDQYADPFGDLPENEGGGQPDQPTEPQAAPAPAPDSSQAPSATPSAETGTSAQATEQLPRTGTPAGLPAALGLALLGSGLLLVYLLGRPERLMAAVTGRPDSILHRAPPKPGRRRR